jgi:hypothetical protein
MDVGATDSQAETGGKVMSHLTMKQRSQLVRAAERGIRREQPIRVGRIVFALAVIVILWVML